MNCFCHSTLGLGPIGFFIDAVIIKQDPRSSSSSALAIPIPIGEKGTRLTGYFHNNNTGTGTGKRGENQERLFSI
jgi:hypothetical protein